MPTNPDPKWTGQADESGPTLFNDGLRNRTTRRTVTRSEYFEVVLPVLVSHPLCQHTRGTDTVLERYTEGGLNLLRDMLHTAKVFALLVEEVNRHKYNLGQAQAALDAAKERWENGDLPL